MNAMLLNICALFLYRMVKNKNSPCTPQKKEVDEVIPTLNSGENSPDSNTLDTIESPEKSDYDEDVNAEEFISGKKQKTENSNEVMMIAKSDDAGTKKYELEPVVVQAEAKDNWISLGDEIFVANLFTIIENYQLCFLVRADKLNVLLNIGYIYPDRGIFVYGAYIEADGLSSLRLVFIEEDLRSFSSISWKYFLKKSYPPATQKFIKKVNFKLLHLFPIILQYYLYLYRILPSLWRHLVSRPPSSYSPNQLLCKSLKADN